jgi:hypothetical protein
MNVSDIVERLRASMAGATLSDRKYERPMTWDEADFLLSEIERLREALREMESAFVLLTQTMQGSEIGIPLDVGLIIVNAREVARAALQKG